MTSLKVFDGRTGTEVTIERIRKGGNSGDGGDMNINERMTGIETAQIQVGMDLQYLKGRAEDMPTKDWVNTRLLAYAGGVSAIIVACATILGYLITSGFSAMAMMVGG